MGRKNRVRHGQLRTDIDQHGQLGADIAAATATDTAGGAKNRPARSAVLDTAQPPADPGDGSADAQLLEPLGGDGGEPPSETDPVSAVGQAEQPTEEKAEEVSDGQAQEAQGGGGEDPAASGAGVAASTGAAGDFAAAAGDTEQEPGPGAAGDGVAGGVAGQALAAEECASPGPCYFTKRSVTIAALPTDGTPASNRNVIDWTRGSTTPAHMGDMYGDHQSLYISTLEGEHRVTPGDWIVRGVKGEHYPVKPDIFAATYDQVATSPEVAADTAEPVPSAQAWRPHTLVEKAGMTAAASMNEAFWALAGPGADFDPHLERVHSNYSLWRPAADFVAANRDAPAEAIAIHLALKKLGGSTAPDKLEISLWNVFKTVFVLVHEALVEADRAAVEALPAGASNIWPGELAMQPQPGAFDAAGFVPRR